MNFPRGEAKTNLEGVDSGFWGRNAISSIGIGKIIIDYVQLSCIFEDPISGFSNDKISSSSKVTARGLVKQRVGVGGAFFVPLSQQRATNGSRNYF